MTHAKCVPTWKSIEARAFSDLLTYGWIITSHAWMPSAQSDVLVNTVEYLIKINFGKFTINACLWGKYLWQNASSTKWIGKMRFCWVIGGNIENEIEKHFNNS